MYEFDYRHIKSKLSGYGCNWITCTCNHTWDYVQIFIWGFPCGSDSEESTCNVGDPGSIPELWRSAGGGLGNPRQYSCLENPMDRGAWKATVHGVPKSQTWLSDLTFTAFSNIHIRSWFLHFACFNFYFFLHGYFFKIFILYLTIGNQECCITFKCPTKWFSYKSICSYSF